MRGNAKTASRVRRKVQHRSRPINSCAICRTKKLKCDRGQPCTSCMRSNKASECFYGQRGTAEGTSAAHSSAGTHEASSDQMLRLQQRVEQLERRVDSQKSNGPDQAQPHAASSRTSSQPNHSRGTVVVKGSRTRFHAVDDGLVQRLESIGGYLREALKDDSVQKERRELELAVPRRQQDFDRSVPSELHAELHDWPRCLESVEKYFKHFENVFRVLHRPQFLESLAHGRDRVSTDIVPQLVLIMVIASSLDRSSEGFELQQRRHSMVQKFLQQLRRGQKITLQSLQTQCLLLIASQMLGQPVDQLWKMSGTLLRQAVIMGLHRDGSETAQLSIYESEIRRRLWYTIEELDFQFSTLMGMQSSFEPLQISCGFPFDVDDVELLPAMTRSPNPVPDELYAMTDNSYQRILARSLLSRRQFVAAVAKGGLSQTPIDELLAFQQNTLKEVHRLAACRLRDRQDSSIQGDVILDVLVRRPLILYHRSHVVQHRNQLHGVKNSDMDLCTSHAIAMMNWIQVLEPDTSASTTGDRVNLLRGFSSMFYTDIIRAASTLLLDVKRLIASRGTLASASGISSFGVFPQAESRIDLRCSEEDLIRTLQHSLSVLLRTYSQPHDIFKDVMFLRLNLSLITDPDRFKNSPSDRRNIIRSILAQLREEIQENPASLVRNVETRRYLHSNMVETFPFDDQSLSGFLGTDDTGLLEFDFLNAGYLNFDTEIGQE